MNNLISIIIVNYNGKKWLKKCLDSLYDQTYKNFEIIFVDNNSPDDSNDYIEEEYPEVKIIKSNKNLGFGGGNNLGIDRTEGEFILLLNNDTWLNNNFLENMLKYYLHNKFDIIAPREINYQGHSLTTHISTIDVFGHPVSFQCDKYKNLRNFYISGVCLLFKKNLYKSTRGFDNDFFMYCEDLDWFWRLNLFLKTFSYVDYIFINHAGAGSTGSGIKYKVFLWRNQNTLQMLLKNYTWFYLLWILPIYFAQNIFEIIFFLISLKPKIAYSYVEGWWFNIINFKKIVQKRKWVQDNRRVSDFEIMKKMYFGFAKVHHLINFYKNNI
ncbi:glycosyltransferase family 2 protein [Patescibacteria group bacterium]|nr:glycosyltransferase family 2 protein [Patescibacteria group bacterium]MBU4098404.1 glycosyltransferase family 2 protein [Patescibacteria group bacterium]